MCALLWLVLSPVRIRTGVALVTSACVFALLSAGPAAAARRAPAPARDAGVVDVYVTLGYQSAAAAGTGMIVTRSGEVLTNNHVVRGATAIRVVDVTTGRSYPASVVGYSVGSDVALLQLSGASGLRTVHVGPATSVRIGSRVTAVGNAGGVGGKPSAVSGTVTALQRSILANDEQGDVESLTGLIETNAPARPGDSGGPLLDRKGRVVGMVTAGSTSFRLQTGGTRAYAIPIASALVRQIAAGQSSTTVHVGPTAFLGVTVKDAAGSGSPAQSGALVTGVVPNSAAQAAGLAAGDVVTSLAGQAVTSSDSLRRAVLSLVPGTPVEVDWTDATGAAGSAQLTPASGPPQ